MSQLKFGLGSYYGSARDTAECAVLAEQAGWDGLFIGDAIWCVDPMISLTASAMVTSRIRLGTMIIPMPLRRPWKVASESAALDNLSGGRLILGLGAGAVWMGWQGYPDEVTDTKARAEMLDESIDILTLLYQRKQFDYAGKHYHLKLTLVDEQYYPPKPVQQPRIPLWVPGIWPNKKSMRRILKCDGLLPEKRDSDGKPADVTPQDIREMKAFIDTNRTLLTPFDIIKEGQTGGFDRAQAQDKLIPWVEAGVTWWIEGLWMNSTEEIKERIKQGPPPMYG
jgi:hypothetical protein